MTEVIRSPEERWQQQEHDRRVRNLGRWLAEEWEEIVHDHQALGHPGFLRADFVLQLMESAFNQGRDRERNGI